MGNQVARSLVVALVAMVGTLSLAAGAFAAGSANGPQVSKGNDAQSKNLPSEIQNGQDRGEPSASKAQASVGSPFSGLDLTVLLGGGLLLIASGVTLSGWVVRRARV